MAGTERPYRVDDEWSRCVFGRRTGAAAAFLAPYLRSGMRLIDCGCGPGSITADLAKLTSVTIWCDRFNVSFGAAALKPQ